MTDSRIARFGATNWSSDRARQLLVSLVHANLVISLAAVGVAITSLAILDLPVDVIPLLFVFGGTFGAYTLNKLWDQAEDATNLPGRAAFVDTYGRVMLGFAVLLYVLGFILLVSWRPSLTVLGIVPPLAAWLYSSGIVKGVYVVKNVFVGAVWGMIPIGIGLYHGQVTWATLTLGGLFAVFLTAAAALFDIKDIQGDRIADIRTIPSVRGPGSTRRLAGLAILGTIPVILLASSVFSARFMVLCGYVGYLGACLPFATQDRGPLFYGLIVDGEHIVIGAVAAVLWLL